MQKDQYPTPRCIPNNFREKRETEVDAFEFQKQFPFGGPLETIDTTLGYKTSGVLYDEDQ
jgi:hypothetical protein